MTVAKMLQTYREQLLKIYDAAEVRAITNLVFENVLQLNILKVEMSRFQLLTTYQREVLESNLARLLRHEPVQYVLGIADFMGMELMVNHATLIPRPETEELVHLIVEEYGADFNGNLLDVGTGSGCIALGLKKMLPNANVFACDISTEALEVAQKNAVKQQLNITFFKCNVLENFNSHVSFDAVVSNPPYIPESEANQMDKNVVHFEPHSALFVPNENPLIFYEAIAEKCRTGWLKKGGKLFVETHFQKAQEVADLFAALRFGNIHIRSDLFGKERMVQADLLT